MQCESLNVHHDCQETTKKAIPTAKEKKQREKETVKWNKFPYSNLNSVDLWFYYIFFSLFKFNAILQANSSLSQFTIFLSLQNSQNTTFNADTGRFVYIQSALNKISAISVAKIWKYESFLPHYNSPFPHMHTSPSYFFLRAERNPTGFNLQLFYYIIDTLNMLWDCSKLLTVFGKRSLLLVALWAS